MCPPCGRLFAAVVVVAAMPLRVGALPGLLGLPGLQARRPAVLAPQPGFMPVVPPETRAALLAKLAAMPAAGQEEEKK